MKYPQKNSPKYAPNVEKTEKPVNGMEMLGMTVSRTGKNHFQRQSKTGWPIQHS